MVKKNLQRGTPSSILKFELEWGHERFGDPFRSSDFECKSSERQCRIEVANRRARSSRKGKHSKDSSEVLGKTKGKSKKSSSSKSSKKSDASSSLKGGRTSTQENLTRYLSEDSDDDVPSKVKREAPSKLPVFQWKEEEEEEDEDEDEDEKQAGKKAEKSPERLTGMAGPFHRRIAGCDLMKELLPPLDLLLQVLSIFKESRKGKEEGPGEDADLSDILGINLKPKAATSSRRRAQTMLGGQSLFGSLKTSADQEDQLDSEISKPSALSFMSKDKGKEKDEEEARRNQEAEREREREEEREREREMAKKQAEEKERLVKQPNEVASGRTDSEGAQVVSWFLLPAG
ncbi:hypothetical protein GUITHDRAFT_141769 [Guillardia theta CCMP2712]|uniref:Uncharacterized protein n=1 Tax=Guillardia theta (strain CCMP2712) TaxID=905079 RepID=L1J138_GUITC|nr:hypothetical protein GUITHDRAFT_141769 [Guillardia theta CCMP2712]EKX41780.1 hypothetical protein GUITHDRAFT_141769 [Guillardia theta CCMP2712]|eukprot:XP_005828760.1 hypothetical protein GUITHDRAFT_141769 [Guillardia theta CCMP2712]